MKKVKLLVLIMLLLTEMSTTQNCNCESNFKWVQKTFEENDAGFQYVLAKKGKDAYAAHNKIYQDKVKAVKKSEECNNLMFEWLRFFRTAHVAIRPVGNNKTETAGLNDKPLMKTGVVSISNADFERYLQSNKRDDLEGVWETPPYKIGIKKEGQSYAGFIMETSAENWKQGEIKVKFDSEKGVFYLRDKTLDSFSVVKKLGINYLQLGNYQLRRLLPLYETEKYVADYFKLINARKPYLEAINSSTLLLRIPSFSGSLKKDIDSVISANRFEILNTKNLIIDLRNNGGGSDGSYREIMPFLYTNPVRVVGVEMLSTKLNNQRMMDFVNNPQYNFSEEDKKWARESFVKLEKQLGSFVNLDSNKVSIDHMDTVYRYPENIGIIIHSKNGSTAEQFLLAAKQSKKVKLFGTTTMGVLDISNMNFVKSPCNDFELGYSLSKSFRIPDMAIDGKGIQPDYFLDSGIEDYEWVEFVSGVLNFK